MSGNDLEARYRHALQQVCAVVGDHQRESLPPKVCEYLRKVCREAMPDHPIWMKRARLLAKEKKGVTPFLEGLDEIE